MRRFLQNWWNGLRYDPQDPRFFTGGDIKIAALGGGSGLFSLLRGLKLYSRSISAIVTVSDSGASSGLLRQEFEIPAPGDIRKCISALALDEELISKLFEYRFAGGSGLAGHTLGNIWLTALTKLLGSFERAVEATTAIFKTAGRVLPSTLERVDLEVKYDDGVRLIGEAHLDRIIKKIKAVSLLPKNIRAYSGAVEAIKTADLILLGPGSLYGSVIPNLLIKGISRAIIENSKALKIYIANCSTERTQTAGYTIDDHIKAIHNHIGKGIFGYCLVNSRIIKLSKDETALGEINNITTEKKEIEGVQIILGDIISASNPLYHNSKKLAGAIIEIYENKRK